ncbi:MAG: hypothetical protein ACYTFG_09100 [Planctomycetota bacterium]|jgi:hypothetical protein
MRRLALFCALGVLVAAVAVFWIPGCVPYLDKPEPDAWMLSNLPGHLGVAFNGEGDTNDVTYTFSNATAGGGQGYTMGRVMLNFHLTQGTAQLIISAGATPLVDTSAVPGHGPWARFDLALTDPGTSNLIDLDVRIVTNNASGTLSVNVDEVEITQPSDRIGFTYSRTFPDSFGDPDPSNVGPEFFHWTPPEGTPPPTPPTVQQDLSASWSVIEAGRSTLVEIFDTPFTSPAQHTFTCSSAIPGPEVQSLILETGDAGPPAVHGYWKVQLTHTLPGGDTAINIQLSNP